MRVAVISDIHGNWHALDAVLHALERDEPDAVWSLGDVVGYGPRPNECCSAVAARAQYALCGNHDLGVLDRIDLGTFTEDAQASALWTRAALSDEARLYLESLEASVSVPGTGAELHHGSPRDPVWEYVLSADAARAALEATAAPLVLVGHSHVPLAISLDGGGLQGGPGLAPPGTEIELAGLRWLLNPGSVGQPRDGDPRAAYLVLDLEARFASFRRVAYSIADTQREMRERGLPEALAARLEHGL